MIIAQVVPLRRFDPSHHWFDYAVPESLSLTVGHLVQVPFLRSRVPGVVWRLTDRSDHSRLRLVEKVLRPEPVLTSWQRGVIERLAQAGATSLGHLLQRALPVFSSRRTNDTPLAWPVLPAQKKRQPDGSTWWYQDRQAACRQAADWLRQASPHLRIVITPTEEDGRDLFRALGLDSSTGTFVSGSLPRTSYRRIYEGVRLGQIRWVIGTAQTLFLPWPSSPAILLDQEEHPGHKQTEQHPRLDVRPLLPVITDHLTILTPAPSLRWYVRAQPTPPHLASADRQLWSLGRPLTTPWITDELQTLLGSAADDHQLLLIVPQRGYASAMVCADCHQAQACPQCHEHVSLFSAGKLSALCHHCRTPVPVTLRCVRCGGQRWFFRGLGIDRLLEQLRKFVAPGRIGTEPTQAVTVNTYRAYRFIPRLSALKTIVVLGGDALRNWPDFSVDERAWQYLWRVQAAAPFVSLAVQTFSPESDFWQRWRRGDHVTWYASEIALRKKMDLPPFSQQWIARLPTSGPHSQKHVTAVLAALQHRHLPGIQAEELPVHGKRGKSMVARILVTAPPAIDLATVLPWQEVFPYPWQVDTSVNSWLV